MSTQEKDKLPHKAIANTHRAECGALEDLIEASAVHIQHFSKTLWSMSLRSLLR